MSKIETHFGITKYEKPNITSLEGEDFQLTANYPELNSFEKKYYREKRYKYWKGELDYELFNELKRYSLLNVDLNKSVYKNKYIQTSNSYHGNFFWDTEAIDNLPVDNRIDLKRLKEFLIPKENITYEEAEEILSTDPNLLVAATTLLAHNYLLTTESINDSSRESIDVKDLESASSRFLFSKEEEKLFFTGRTLLVEFNKIYNDKYIKQLIREVDSIIILFNIGLVGCMVNKYQKRCERTDLFQEGKIGLMRVLKTFDIDRDNSFSTYATWWIRRMVQRYENEKGGNIRIPVHLRKKKHDFYNARKELKAKIRRKPTFPEIVKYCQENDIYIGKPESLKLAIYSYETLSYDSPVGSDEESPFIDFLKDPNSDINDYINDSDAGKEVTRLYELAKLTYREQRILNLWKGIESSLNSSRKEGCTLQEIAEEFGVTRERIRQIKEGALRKVREVIRRVNKSS